MNKKTYIKIFLLLISLLLTSQTWAVGIEVGYVRVQYLSYGVSASSAGKMFFFLDGNTKTGNPSCSIAHGGERWVINNDWPVAKYYHSVLLAAQIAGKQVRIDGTGGCGVWSDSESVGNVRLADE